MKWLEPIQLIGKYVTLELLTKDHIEDLKAAVLDGESWKVWYGNVPSPDEMETYVLKAIANKDKGHVTFAVRCNNTKNIVGTTRYYNVDAKNKRSMIGYTWYSASVRRTPINTECKLLLLSYLFEENSAIAVEFRIHFFNQASRSAVERLGAKQDGILRNHQIMKDGSIRDTVCYSIINAEWSAVKSNLLHKLNQ